MRLSEISGSNCFCCCCSSRHFGFLIFVLLVSSVVNVSPEFAANTHRYKSQQVVLPTQAVASTSLSLSLALSSSLSEEQEVDNPTITYSGQEEFTDDLIGIDEITTNTAEYSAQIITMLPPTTTWPIPLLRTNHYSPQSLLSTAMISTTTRRALSQPYQEHEQEQREEHRKRRQAAENTEEQNEKCRRFVEGEQERNELYSPDYPNDYPKNINCTRVITAPKGQIIRLDFRNSFHIEDAEECKFDSLEIRDGQYGFSTLIGKYCGTDFPPEITSRERYLWLHFHSDESIAYSGFTAVYEFIDRNKDAPSTDINCTIDKDGDEGFINSTDVPSEIRDTVIRNKIPLDCMWRIQVREKWKIQIKFLDFKLSKPNDCEINFLDIFPEQTVMPLRVKNFCGSAGEGINSDSNILHIRFYAEKEAINSTFAILFTAFRDRANIPCIPIDEYDCDDATCIAGSLECNGRDNCKFRWDEEKCDDPSESQSEHMTIIIIVFGLILGGMVITFLVNCIRNIMRDQKIIREHIRQSKESKLDEMGRNSKARSRESTVVMSTRKDHSQTSLQLDDVSNQYFQEVTPHTSKVDLHEKEHSILRHHHHDAIVQTSLSGGDNSSQMTTGMEPSAATGNLCEAGCQTRESLFATSRLSKRGRVSGPSSGDHITPASSIPTSHISTITFDPTTATATAKPANYGSQQQHVQPPIGFEEHMPPFYPPRPGAIGGGGGGGGRPQELCHHHFQHQQQQHQQQHPHQHQHQHHQHHHQYVPVAEQQQLATTGVIPHDHRQFHYHHGQHPPQQQPSQQQQEPVLPGSKTTLAKSKIVPTTTNIPSASSSSSRSKQPKKDDDPKAFSDMRSSAPDVIIMTSH